MSRVERRKKEEAEKRSKKKSKGKLKSWQKVLITVGIIVICALIGAYAYVHNKLNKLNRPELEENIEDLSNEELSCVDIDGYVNILLLGVDSRDMKDYDGSRSDCIMIASIEEETGDVSLTSIYRDTYVNIAERDYYSKINHAMATGGPKIAMKTINEAMDLNINKYIMFNFKAVADVVDELEGLDIDIEEYEIDELNRVNEETARVIGQKNREVLKPGLQTLDGAQAVSYGRMRYGVGDDFKRTDRMRIVADLITKKAKKEDLKTLNNLLDLVLDQIRTNLSNKDILIMASALNKYKVVESSGFPYNVTTGTLDGASYVFPANLYDDVAEFHKKVFGRENYVPGDRIREMSDKIIEDYSGVGSQYLDPNDYIENPTVQPEPLPEEPETPPQPTPQPKPKPKPPTNPNTGDTKPPETPPKPENPPEPPTQPENPPENPPKPENPPESGQPDKPEQPPGGGSGNTGNS